ncbi:MULTISPECIES: RagB/SusD family nutrient uptake outer membrane protein [unclassified Spirosoma]|uniref:RagB/SusD family nutrient uptake outer membrane protein n=1 Tax=unclassified Spirosoma TaxID=2621999 RepID=UPI0009650389|nr:MULTISPECIES: RagB/SusD family nutrient uptake outer membrane protein [unclassified Spirosoma]MBN8823030.1 RagB/SusD family nutrient uptake outer membrane protein [Spirosoma sp.]OJW73129.1 MAG: RagB/SusD family nutrient uptake outer membrane protein [Spirosoma sp. 48-14]
MKQITIKVLLGCSALMLVGQSCTDLSETTYDVIPTSGSFGSTAAQQAALIGPLYNGLGDYYGNMSNLNTTTDEQIVPTRGGDWKDGDNWKRLYQHTWDPVTDNGQFNGPWSWCYNNITAINQQLGTITDANTKAELRALRAFFHYQAMDLFGNVIISDAVTSASPKQSTRAEVFAFVEKELLAVYPTLSEEPRGSYYGRMNKWVADMILAKLYLNAQVYIGTARWADAITRCDNIIKSGKFQIAGDYFSNFVTQNQNSTETILATPFDKSKRGGMNVQMKTLHYLNQLTYNLGTAPWNGWATVTEFYNSFDDKDIRKKQWIVGQQYDAAGKPLMDDALPMVFRPEVESFVFDAGANGRLAGARSQKYQIQANNTFTDQDNDFVIYRLADVYMMRGEAKFRLGQTADALADFNIVRARAGMPNYTTLTLDEILAERGRELAWEQHRRQDLIRFGQFTKAWRFKPASQDFRTLFPIPKDQLSLNPNLKQNPGY